MTASTPELVEAQGPPESRAERAPLSAWWMLAVLLVLYILAMMDRQILAQFVDPIRKDLGLSDVQMSLVLGPAFAFANAAAVYPLGWAADRWRRGALLAAAAGLWSTAMTASAFVRSFGGLVIGRVGVGVCEAALLPSAYSLIADAFPRKRMTTALAIFNMGTKLGIAASFLVGGLAFAVSEAVGPVQVPLLGELSGWRMVIAMMGVPGLLIALLTLTFPEPARRAGATPKGQKESILPFMQAEWATVVPLLVGFALMGVCSGALNAWAPTHITRAFGWTPAQYGPAMSLISLAAAWSIPLKGLVVDWLYARGVKDAHVRFYTWIQMACVPLLVAAFVMRQPWAFLGLYGAVNVAVLSYLLYAGAVVQMIAPARLRGQVTAVFLFCSSVLAQGIGPTAVASITDFVFHDEMKLGASLGIVSTTALLASIVALRLGLRGVRRTLESQTGVD